MNNQPHYKFGLGARLMEANSACIACGKGSGFTVRNLCENCATLQDVMDTAFSILHSRTLPGTRPGFYEVGYAGLDQLEASLVTIARHLGLEQRMAFGTDRAHLPVA